MIELLDQAVARKELAPDVAATGRQVQAQLDAESPNGFTIGSLLKAIAEAATSVTRVAAAVAAVRGLIGV